jgi:spore coat protein H
MPTRISLLLCCAIAAISLSAQNPFPAPGPLYRDDAVPRVDIWLPADSLAILLAPGNEQSNYHWHATFAFDNGNQRDTLYNVGLRLRGNTSRTAEKKSFKVSFNTYEPGRQWNGVEKLNLNGEHNDPAVCRAKVCWDLLRLMGVPAPRANHARLYINGEFRGLYVNVEHIDEQFVETRFGNKNGNLYKCLWPADLAYLGNNPNLYKFESGGRRAYDLRTNEEMDDYTDLAQFVDVLNNTPISFLPCALEQVINVETLLPAMAFDVLAGNWDGPFYNKNNFYLYHNQATGLFEYIPYDLDNTLGIDWLGQNWGTRNVYNWAHPNEPRPLFKRVLQVPEYRERFTYYLQLFLDNVFNEEVLFPYLENLKQRIAPYAQADPYRPLDYGFTYADFETSFVDALPFFHTDFGLQGYITTRHNSAQSQLENTDVAPIITRVTDNNPSAYQDISLSAQVVDNTAVTQVMWCYRLNGAGSDICIPMYDDGQHLDGAAGDGRYGAELPALNAVGMLEYYLTAGDNTGQQSRKPVCGFYELPINDATLPVAINEVMAANSSTIADNFGEYDDWVELYNYSDVPVYLGGRYLSDNPTNPDKWAFPDIWIQAQEYLLVWADDDANQGPLHTDFKLDAAGEFIGIYDNAANNYALIDGLAFGPQSANSAVGRLPDGFGAVQALSPTPGGPNMPITNIDELIDNQIDILVFPNPFSKELWVRSPAAGTLQLVDVWGRVVGGGFQPVSEGLWRFSSEGLVDGVYFLVIHMGKGVIFRKVVLVRP